MPHPSSPSSIPAVLTHSAFDWLRLLRERRIGAVELLNLHLSQLDHHNPSINAVVERNLEAALAAAWKADNTLPSARGPLHGLPMTIKDSFEVEGLPATCGFSFLGDHFPERDADAVARLRSAGAIFYGKTNVPQGAFDWQSYNSLYGTTNNPWNVARSPGGSSGGPAAALAAGFTPLELGSDMGGSIRVPSLFCGVFGHKPSHGIVPSRGHIPPLPGNGEHLRLEMGVAGPMARSAVDLELALDVLVGADTQHSVAWQVRVPPSRHERLEDFRIALWANDDAFAVDAASRAAIESWADDLRRLGARIDTKARPKIDWHAAYETYLTALLQLLGIGASKTHVDQLIEEAQAGRAGAYTVRLARALSLRHHEYFQIMLQREAISRCWQEFFGDHDLFICPAFSTVAYPHDQRGNELASPIAMGEQRTILVDGRHQPYFDGFQWPSVATVADLPATAVPIGRFVEGLPMGVQVIGPRLEDRTPLRFAQLVEQALGGFQPPPLLDA